jgi:predicted nuclease with TOPRIM domain
VDERSQNSTWQLLRTPPTSTLESDWKTYLNVMDVLLEKQLKEAEADRKSVMHEFLRLKAELVRTQQRNDDLRCENRALREALHAAEHEVTNLFSYASQADGAEG